MMAQMGNFDEEMLVAKRDEHHMKTSIVICVALAAFVLSSWASAEPVTIHCKMRGQEAAFWGPLIVTVDEAGARATAGSKPQRSKHTTGRCGRSARALKKFLGPGSAVIVFVRYAGSAWPKQSCKSISPPSLTISNASGGSKRLERI